MNTLFEGKIVAELAAFVGGRVVGDGGERLIRQVASLESAGEGDIAFVEDAKFFERARRSKASCVIVPEGARLFEGEEIALTARDNACVIEVRQPKLAFALIAEFLHPPQRSGGAIHPTAHVAATAMVDERASVGPYVHIGARAHVGAGTQILNGAFIGDDARIGRDCIIHPHVTLYGRIILGDRVILHAGVVIGADGFGYVRGADGYTKFPQIGTVIIEDDVEIGAHTCVDRGALGVTRIGRGTKIDNLVQVAHNVTIGERVVIAAQTGISGSTVIEDDAVIGGQVGMGDHARVGRGATVGSKAGILPGKIVRPGAVVWGVPVRPLDEYKRLNAHFGRLPQMRAEIDALRKLVQELQARLNEKRLDSGG